MKNLIELKNISKIFKTEAGEFPALKNINLSIGRGEFVGVIGKSGSGKSTLINMITGIDKPTSGKVYVDGSPIHNMDENSIAKYRGKKMGIVFQFFQLLPNLTAIENIMLPMDFTNTYDKDVREKKALEILESVDIADQAYKMPAMLSGGQQQRVAIGRALANDPPILFADEPTGNLDSKTSEKIFSLFEELVRRNKTVLMVTHDEDQARRVNRSLVISDGEIIEEFLAGTFPTLSESELIWMTKRLKRKNYKGGQIILKKDMPVDSLYLVTKGKVEIVLHVDGMAEMVVAEFCCGQYFGEIELLRHSNSVATARAAIGSEVEVATLPKDDFLNLLNRSSETKKQVDKVAKIRLAENIQKTKRK
ncbi:ATP-binding cassette domain-containing protein [Candidatus Woesebacteria bacterium]|nr:ATP-binding cassette domain-containing protein [Candidatus Woesebacteria bacterium]